MFECLKDQRIVHLYGLDIQKFLSNLVTNSIIDLEYSYNYLLNNQGRYLFDLFVFKESDESYYVEIAGASFDAFIKRLQFYKLRSKFEIEDLSHLYQIYYSKNQAKQEGLLYSFQDPRYEELGYRSAILASRAGEYASDSKNLYLRDKYEYTIPDGSVDLIYERSIPVEYGADEMHAISYNKGCYVGQEVISRVKYQGEIRKGLYKLKSSLEKLDKVESGRELFDNNGNNIGIFCSGYQAEAIALLRYEYYDSLPEKSLKIDDIKVDIIPAKWRN